MTRQDKFESQLNAHTVTLVRRLIHGGHAKSSIGRNKASVLNIPQDAALAFYKAYEHAHSPGKFAPPL